MFIKYGVKGDDEFRSTCLQIHKFTQIMCSTTYLLSRFSFSYVSYNDIEYFKVKSDNDSFKPTFCSQVTN